MLSFDELLSKEVRQADLPDRDLPGGECRSQAGNLCSLCHAGRIGYADEVGLKERALQAFWGELFPGRVLQPLVLSPRGRQYRTVTKRKVFHSRQGVELGLIDPGEAGAEGSFPVARCAIEPENHAGIYREIGAFVAHPQAKAFRDALQYAVIKGNYDEQSVLLAVRAFSPAVVREANRLSHRLTRAEPSIAGVFAYEGSPQGRYYMGTQEGRSSLRIRKLHGKAQLFHRTLGKPFLYPPTVFSQVNHGMLETLVQNAALMLSLQPHEILLDLYCGYGLFGLLLADRVQRVVGVEVSRDAIEAARANAKRQRCANARFHCSTITAETLPPLLRHVSTPAAVLLDPPRGGTLPGVIEAVAAARPKRVVHLFCNMEVVGAEIRRWEHSGYRMQLAVPFDLFPGTATVELMVSLAPGEAVSGE